MNVLSHDLNNVISISSHNAGETIFPKRFELELITPTWLVEIRSKTDVVRRHGHTFTDCEFIQNEALPQSTNSSSNDASSDALEAVAKVCVCVFVWQIVK